MNLKQTTFGEPEPETVKKTSEKRGKAQPSYWVCVNGHIFEHKYRVHPDREKEMNCPICRRPVKNKSSKGSYLFYLKKQGRVDEKVYRADQIRKKKLRERKEAQMERESREEHA